MITRFVKRCWQSQNWSRLQDALVIGGEDELETGVDLLLSSLLSQLNNILENRNSNWLNNFLNISHSYLAPPGMAWDSLAACRWCTDRRPALLPQLSSGKHSRKWNLKFQLKSNLKTFPRRDFYEEQSNPESSETMTMRMCIVESTLYMFWKYIYFFPTKKPAMHRVVY